MTQGKFRYLDRYFKGSDIFDINRRDSFQVQQIVADFFGDQLEISVIGVRGQCHGHDIATGGEGPNDRFLGFNRECGYRIHLGLYVIQHTVQIGSGHDLYGRVAAAFPCRTGETLYVFGTFQRLFDTQTHRRLRLFRRRPEIGHTDLNHAKIYIWKFFLIQTRIGQESARQKDHHHQISGNGIFNKPCNRRSQDQALP